MIATNPVPSIACAPAGPHAMSYYADSVNTPSAYPRLTGSCRVDVAIVGGGFSGVASALELAERGYSVALIEGQRIGWGASGRNGGQVTGSLSGEAGLRRHLRDVPGGDVAAFVWDLRWQGQRLIADRVARYGIACDLKHGHLQAAWKPGHVAALKADRDAAAARGMGDVVRWIEPSALRGLLDTPLYHGALRNDANLHLHLHPLNLVLGEAAAAAGLGVRIFEASPVIDIVHGAPACVVTADGSVVADSVLLAGGAYHRLAGQRLRGRMFSAALGIVTTEPLGALARQINPQDLAVYDTRFVLDYYRLTGDGRLLFGGGANYSGRENADIAAYLRPRLEATFPALAGVAIDYQWQGMAGIVPNRMPLLGRLADNVYYAQGYSGHGIATSHLLARVLAEAIDGQMTVFDAFAGLPHGRVPFGERFGNTLLALGMTWYRLLEILR